MIVPIVVEGKTYKRVSAIVDGTCIGCAGAYSELVCRFLPECDNLTLIFIEVPKESNEPNN